MPSVHGAEASSDSLASPTLRTDLGGEFYCADEEWGRPAVPPSLAKQRDLTVNDEPELAPEHAPRGRDSPKGVLASCQHADGSQHEFLFVQFQEDDAAWRKPVLNGDQSGPHTGQSIDSLEVHKRRQSDFPAGAIGQ